MKYVFAALAMAMALAPVIAQEPAEAQLEFIRKLRAKGYADLALMKLEEWRKNPSPGLALQLPLELARTRLALGRDKGPEERLAIAATAEGDLNDLVAKHKGKPEAIQGRLEIARLAAFQGQAWLNKALRQDEPRTQNELARKAEEFFARSGKQLEEAVKELPEEDRLQVRFDRGITYIDQARTYIDTSDDKANKLRANLVVEARKIFEDIVREDSTTAPGMLAAAWLVKCYTEGDEPLNALKFYKRVMDLTGPGSGAAKRWVRLFRMQGILNDPTLKEDTRKKLKLIQDEGLTWLKDYPTRHQAPEGQAVRYELAEAFFKEGNLANSAKDPKDKALVPKLYSEAQKYYGALAASDSDFAELANQKNLAISFARLGDQTSLDSLFTFDDCFLKGQYELYKLRDAKSDKDRQARLRNGVQALRRALAFADAKTSPDKIGEARFALLSIYFTSGDSYRAAVAGEALGREQPPLRRSALAAGYAIESYANILPHEDNDQNRERLRNLALFVVETNRKLWENDPVTPVARFHLAMLYEREDKFTDAIEQLEKLPTTYDGYTYAQGQLVFIALKARDRAGEDKEKKGFEDKARAALGRLKLPPHPDPSTAFVYFLAQLESGRFLYMDAVRHLNSGEMLQATQKFVEMTKFTDQLRGQFDKLNVKLRQESHDQVAFGMAAMEKLNRYGRAEIAYRAGAFDKVLDGKLTGDVVTHVEKLGKGDGPIRMKDYEITGNLLGLALRAHVQKGDIAKAKTLLKLLERLSAEDGALGTGSAAVLRTLVIELNMQVKELKKAGDQAALQQVVEKFTAFLDDYAKNPGPKGLQPNDVLFLGECYESLNHHDKAAGFYKQYPAPKALEMKIDPKQDEFKEADKEISHYWGVQLRLAQQLRLTKQHEEAAKVLHRLKNHPNSRGGLQAEMELNQILEDKNLWGTAITRWGEFLRNPALQRNLGSDNFLKKMYFDAYVHHAFCCYKYSQQDKVKGTGKEKQFLSAAAGNLLKLQHSPNPEGWNLVSARVEEILSAEPPLRQQYQELKAQYDKK
jgi:hypothetical protein